MNKRASSHCYFFEPVEAIANALFAHIKILRKMIQELLKRGRFFWFSYNEMAAFVPCNPFTAFGFRLLKVCDFIDQLIIKRPIVFVTKEFSSGTITTSSCLSDLLNLVMEGLPTWTRNSGRTKVVL